MATRPFDTLCESYKEQVLKTLNNKQLNTSQGTNALQFNGCVLSIEGNTLHLRQKGQGIKI